MKKKAAQQASLSQEAYNNAYENLLKKDNNWLIEALIATETGNGKRLYPKELGELVLHWHTSQRDAVYALGSSILAGASVESDLVEDAEYNLKNDLNETQNQEDKIEIKIILEKLSNDFETVEADTKNLQTKFIGWSHDDLVDGCMRAIERTNTTDNGGFNFYIDKDGFYTVSSSIEGENEALAKSDKAIKIANTIKKHFDGQETIASKKILSKIASKIESQGFKVPFVIKKISIK